MLASIGIGRHTLGSSTTRRTDVRLICATNADLQREVQQNRFRQDLFYRINTIEIHIPPLRDRREDILPLAAHFLRTYRAKYRRDIEGFSPAAETAMQVYPWDGNVRELAHAVERSVLLAGCALLTPDDLRLDPAGGGGGGSTLESMTLEQAERHLISQALERTRGSLAPAARLLGISYKTLQYRVRKHGLDGR